MATFLQLFLWLFRFELAKVAGTSAFMLAKATCADVIRLTKVTGASVLWLAKDSIEILLASVFGNISAYRNHVWTLRNSISMWFCSSATRKATNNLAFTAG